MNRVTLADLMSRDFVGVSESDDIEAAARTMRDAGESTAIVLRGTKPVGAVTAGDVLDHFVDGERNGTTIADVMTETPPSLRPEADLVDASAALSQSDSDALLVATGDGVHGLVTANDIATVPREPGEVEPDSLVVASQPDVGGTSGTEEVDSYAEQGICEACGSLGRNLTNVNGQLVCPECKAL